MFGLGQKGTFESLQFRLEALFSREVFFRANNRAIS